jgi:hypothetical protein
VDELYCEATVRLNPRYTALSARLEELTEEIGRRERRTAQLCGVSDTQFNGKNVEVLSYSHERGRWVRGAGVHHSFCAPSAH